MCKEVIHKFILSQRNTFTTHNNDEEMTRTKKLVSPFSIFANWIPKVQKFISPI